MLPSTIAPGGFTGLALLLLLLVLEVSPALALLNQSGFHHLSAEAVEQPLLRLVPVHNELDVVGREEEGVRVRQRRADDGHELGIAG